MISPEDYQQWLKNLKPGKPVLLQAEELNPSSDQKKWFFEQNSVYSVKADGSVFIWPRKLTSYRDGTVRTGACVGACMARIVPNVLEPPMDRDERRFASDPVYAEPVPDPNSPGWHYALKGYAGRSL